MAKRGGRKEKRRKRDRARFECISSRHKRKYYFTTEYAYKRHMRTWHGMESVHVPKKETTLKGFQSFK